MSSSATGATRQYPTGCVVFSGAAPSTSRARTSPAWVDSSFSWVAIGASRIPRPFGFAPFTPFLRRRPCLRPCLEIRQALADAFSTIGTVQEQLSPRADNRSSHLSTIASDNRSCRSPSRTGRSARITYEKAILRQLAGFGPRLFTAQCKWLFKEGFRLVCLFTC